MGHTEVLNYLKNKCLSGDYNYYTVAQIRNHFIHNPDDCVSINNIAKNITWLNGMGQLESKKIGQIHYYRFKKAILEQSSF